MTKSTVYITGGEGPFLNAKKACASIDAEFFRGKKILVKPNIGRLVSPGKGINTHPEAVAGVIEALQNAGAKKIAIGESPIIGVKIMKAFELGGITAVAEKYNCELLDFDNLPKKTIPIPEGELLKDTVITSALDEYDILLSLPVAKCHMHTGVTLGLKNMKGCLYRREKIRYHQLEYPEGIEKDDKTLDVAIADLLSIVKPDVTVLDGYTGLEGLGPSGGDPVHSDFALASTDAVAADITGCTLMGKNPQDIPHIKIHCEREGLSCDINDYDVYPENFRDNITPYKNPPTDISKEYPDVQLYDVDSCSACLSTVMLFLKRFHTDMTQYISEDEKLCLAIGKGIKDITIPEGTILVGNCARRPDMDKGKFVKGCPPVASHIYEVITGKEPSKNEPDLE